VFLPQAQDGSHLLVSSISQYTSPSVHQSTSISESIFDIRQPHAQRWSDFFPFSLLTPSFTTLATTCTVIFTLLLFSYLTLSSFPFFLFFSTPHASRLTLHASLRQLRPRLRFVRVSICRRPVTTFREPTPRRQPSILCPPFAFSPLFTRLVIDSPSCTELNRGPARLEGRFGHSGGSTFVDVSEAIFTRSPTPATSLSQTSTTRTPRGS
jgi:hypothetical protein